MTEILARDLREVVETVWTITLGFDVLDPLGSLPPPPEHTWCGCVQVNGAWSGMVKVCMSEQLTRRAAAAMFGAAPEALCTDDLTDALGEITNMTGGNVKALLPGPSQLSLPSVVLGTDSDSARGRSLLREVAFQTGGSHILVQVFEGARRAA
jgi:chemotaxis protein CheX